LILGRSDDDHAICLIDALEEHERRRVEQDIALLLRELLQLAELVFPSEELLLFKGPEALQVPARLQDEGRGEVIEELRREQDALLWCTALFDLVARDPPWSRMSRSSSQTAITGILVFPCLSAAEQAEARRGNVGWNARPSFSSSGISTFNLQKGSITP
jgi:hypothetical protein